MKFLPYWVMGALLVATLLFAVVSGGDYWIIPAIVWPIVGVYAIVDRRLRRKEGPGERLMADADPRH